MDADAVVVHKEHHTSYYPGAETVTALLVYDRKTGVILGGQTSGYKGADKRLDVIATATAAKLTVSELADVDFAYSPPIGTANDAMNMAAYTAENRMSGFSPSVTVAELDQFVSDKSPVYVDVRDSFAYEKSHIKGALHIPLEFLAQNLHEIPTNRPVIVYDETGKKGHQALRILKGAGYTEVTNISGGHTSLQRFARSLGFRNLKIDLLPLEQKTVHGEEQKTEEKKEVKARDENSTLIVDVRTPEEFEDGAVPEAINIPLDELAERYEELGNNPLREIVVYCATGARSAYAQRVLMQIGYTNVKNGGGIAAMMARRNAAKATPAAPSNGPLVVDVRTPEEFYSGAYPGSVNIPLDELHARMDELGSKSREIILYCASGARSAYAQRMLMQLGFTNTRNGGGIMQMMRQRVN
jgi:rhodanese-related sulfurtransferase